MKKTPKLRFKEFSGDWESKKLIDICDKKDRYSFTGGPFGSDLKSEHYTGEGVQIIQLQNIGDGNFVNENKIYTSKEKADELISCNIYPGEIIIAKMADPVARACIVPKHRDRYLMASDGIRVVVDKDNYCTIFTLNYINSNYFRKKAIINSTGATRLRIGLSELKNLTLNVPNLEEQEKIASFFSLIDDKISLQGEKVEALKDYKKGMMQKIFSRELRFKDDDGRDYPEWEDKKLKSILKEVSEKTKENNQHEVISSTTNGLFLQKEYFNREIASSDNTGYKIIRRNQVVLSPQNLWMGNINFNEKYDIGIVSPSYKVFDINDKFDSKYIGYILRTPRAFYEFMQSSEQGASIVRRNLNMDLFNEISFDIPCKEEQVTIAKFIGNIDLKIDKEQEKLDYLNEYKKGLLQQMFV